MGDRLIPPTPSNPKGYFESFEIERINVRLLSRAVPGRPWGPLGRLFPDRPGRSQRWLSQVPLDAPLRERFALAREIARLTARRPFCFKDPRFCYTLPAWRPHLGDAVFVTVFRHPAETARSIVTECATAPYLHDVRMDFNRALGVWRSMYEHVLRRHRFEGEWLFVHMQQLLAGDGLERIAAITGAPIDVGFPDRTLRRSSGDESAPAAALAVYRELCELAEY
jgi:hypothetical protein